VVNLYDELAAQVQEERAANLKRPVRFEIGPAGPWCDRIEFVATTLIPRTAVELARWARS
jgi:hypothetical protein